MKKRRDSYKVKQDRYEITSQGFLVAEATLTRTGVFDYYEGGEKVRELRPEEEVFSPESLDSLKFVPLTFEHPTELVDIDNVDKYDIGSVGEIIERDGDFVKAKVIVKNKAVVDFILDRHKAGKNIELSCGYTSDIKDEAGTHPKDGDYTKKQTNIRYNHLSIVEKGRAGKEVKFKLDKQDEEIKMDVKNIKLDDFDQVQAKFKADADEIEALKVKLDSANEEVNKYKADAEELKAKLDAMDEEKTKLDSEMNELKEQAETAKLSAKVKDLKVKTDGLDSRGIKVEVIKLVKKDFDGVEKSDDEINARFDMAFEALENAKGKESLAKLNAFSGAPGEEKELSPRDKMIENQKKRNNK